MKKSQILMIITILVIIILILGIVLVWMNKRNRQQEELNTIENQQQSNTIQDLSQKQPVKDRNIYYTVIDCANKYLKFCTSKSKEELYTILDESYRTQNKITIDNVLQYVNLLEKKVVLKTTQILETNVDDYHSNFYLSGKISDLIEDETQNERDFSVIIKLDYENEKFRIIPSI